jgi:putative oxidoreductase
MQPALTPDLSTFGLREHRRDRAAHIALWTGQVVLALVFLITGGAKLALARSDLALLVSWGATTPEPLIRLIGAAELAGALGLVLPSLTGVRPGLTSLAAAGLAILMAFATGFHLARGETLAAVMPAIIGVVAVAVAWGRRHVSPIEPRPLPPMPEPEPEPELDPEREPGR